MTSEKNQPYGDPITYPFWEAAQERKLLIQRCPRCGSHQYYPRPFCLACSNATVDWVQARGEGVIYSMTTVRLQILPELTPPYVVAVVQLDEGPRMLSNIEGGSPEIGGRVRLAWRERANAPPLPVFKLQHNARV